jgi:hypothetical protein
MKKVYSYTIKAFNQLIVLPSEAFSYLLLSDAYFGDYFFFQSGQQQKNKQVIKISLTFCLLNKKLLSVLSSNWLFKVREVCYVTMPQLRSSCQ